MRRKFTLLPRSRRGALIVGAFGGGTIIGKLGGQVFQRSPFGNVVRQFVKPVNPNSTRQVDVRLVLDFLSTAWTNDLTTAQRTDWINYARNTPIVNKTGAPQFLNGRQQFIRTLFIPQFLTAAANVYYNAPTTPGISNVRTPRLEYVQASGILRIVSMAAGQPSNFDNVYLISRNLSNSRNFWKGPFDFTTTSDNATTFPFNLRTYSPLPALGDKVFVQTRTFDPIRRKVSQPFILEVIAS